MWLVRLALRRPYTFVVMALLLLLSGIYVVRRTPTDILPEVDQTVLSVVWTYGGLPAKQMERQITQFSEYSLAGNVADVKSIHSDSYDGVSVIRLTMQPGANVPTGDGAGDRGLPDHRATDATEHGAADHGYARRRIVQDLAARV